ncbi:MAG: tetratricopeptide repeat protein [Nitrospiraceae bacterium]|nr:tetratricopeptide repeat protein [Nitrospiraceae bacterium]
MKRTTRGIALASSLFAALLLLPICFTACSKEKEEPAGKSKEAAINPYSSESVFTEVKKKLEKNPDDVDTLYHLADLYDRNNLYPQAIETYEKVVKLKPDMGYAYLKIGTAYDRIDKPAEAVAAFKRAEKHMPNYPVLYNNMGVAYGKMNKLNEEVICLKKAIRLRPTYTAAHFNLGITYLKLKDKKEAKKQYDELMKFDEGAAQLLMKEIDKAP